MKTEKRKQAILTYMADCKRAKPKGILNYIQSIGNTSVSRMTIARDLKELIEQNKVKQYGSGRGSYYTLVEYFELLQEYNVEDYFSVLQDKREIYKTFNNGIFKSLAHGRLFTEKEQEYLLSLNKQYIQNRTNLHSDTIFKKEFERILIEFSWKSSSIEGNTYSLLDTEVLLKENKSAEGKTSEETQMILNHKEAFTYIYEHADDFIRLTNAKVEQVHTLLVKKLDIEKGLRSSPVGITGTNFRPLDNIHQITEGLEKMIELVNSKEFFFEKAFIVLLLISYLQCFADGNKRTARLISNAILLAYGTTPMSYRAVDEAEYKKATLLFYEKNSLVYFKQIFIEQYEFAVKTYFQS